MFAVKVRCHGDSHHNHKLTQIEVDEIKELLKEGKLTQKQIANKYNVLQQCISDIKTNRRRKTGKNYIEVEPINKIEYEYTRDNIK